MSDNVQAPFITLAQAELWAKNFRDSHQAGQNYIKGYMLEGGADMKKLLDQHGCVEVRYYFGLDTSGTTPMMKLFAVGVDANGDDLYNGLILDHSVPCPPMCGKPNPLNGNQSDGGC